MAGMIIAINKGVQRLGLTGQSSGRNRDRNIRGFERFIEFFTYRRLLSDVVQGFIRLFQFA